MIEDVLITPQTIKKAIGISKLSPSFRTEEEARIYTAVLSQFDFILKKVGKDNLLEAAQVAADCLKHLRVPAGKFLYHLGKLFLVHIIVHFQFYLLLKVFMKEKILICS